MRRMNHFTRRFPKPLTMLLLVLFPACLIGVATGAFTWSSLNAQASKGLPGAAKEINAADFESLQAAFAEVSMRGGVLRLPPGEFHIDEPLLIFGGDVAIVGAGTSTLIINDNKKGEPALRIANPMAKRSGGVDRKHNLWRVRVSHLRIEGNPKSGHGIDARYVNEILLDDVSVSRNGGDGIRLDYCYEDPRICDSLITYNKATGLNLLGCHDIVVSANQFEENQDALHCIDGYNLTMSGNNLDDHLGRGVVIENTYGSVVASNMIEECAGDAIVLDRDCYGITLSANVIAHNGGGIDLRDAHGCAVSANTFVLLKTHAVRVGPNSGRIAVSGNSFCDSYIGKGQERRLEGDRQAGGLVVNGAPYVSATGNVFSGLDPHAVQTRNARQMLFAGNLIVDATLDAPDLPAINDHNLIAAAESSGGSSDASDSPGSGDSGASVESDKSR